jgi:hypothetical protein
VVAVVDIVVIKVDVMGVFILAGREVNLLAILDMVLKVVVIDHVVVWFSRVMHGLGRVRGLF